MGDANTTAPASRLARWRAGWRVSLRMARRDVRRHRGRSLLVVIMVGLPVLLLTAGSTLWFSEDLDTAERLPLQLGQTQGYLVEPMDMTIHQFIDPRTSYGNGPDTETTSKVVPGYGPGQETAALARLLGATLHPVTLSSGTVRVDKVSVRVAVLGVDAPSAARVLSPKVSLASGRWARSPDEVVVTDLGLAAGLPRSGTVQLRVPTPEGRTEARTVTVVGVGTGYASWGAEDAHPIELIGQPASSPNDRQWLVERATPITWPEIERLNTYGVGVYSRHVVEHPDTMVLPPGITLPSDTNALFVVLAASFGLLLLTTMLAGPAFAVSASRQRHSLALAASNGATRPQLRRTVLGQALVLGVLSAVVGAVSGVVLGLAAASVTHAIRPDHFFGPPQVSWSSVLIVAAAGITSSVVAALIPSRGLGRLDIVSVLKGQNVSAPLRRRVPIVGAALTAIGVGAVLFASYRAADAYFYVFLGGAALIVAGSLLIVPLVLSLVARIAHLLPLPTRMAAREAGRLRGRATPTVAAIMGGAAVLATVCIGLQADTERGARSYTPQLLEGQGIINSPDNVSREDAQAIVRAADPALLTLTPRSLMPRPDGTAVALAAVQPGCSFAETAPQIAYDPTTATPPGDTLPRCATIASDAYFPGSGLVIADAGDLSDFAGLDDSQRRALAAGGLAVLDPAVARTLPRTTPQWQQGTPIARLRPLDIPLDGDTSTWYRYSFRTDDRGVPVASSVEQARVSFPVVKLDHEQWMRLLGVGYGGVGAFLTTSAVERLDIPMMDSPTLVRGPSPITEAQERAVQEAVQTRSPDAGFTVERGYQRDDTFILAIVISIIALVILVATLIATALGQAEAAPLLGTLAAVGATRRTRRALAASQATYLALVGAVLGVLVGLAPGIAISRILTTSYTEGGGSDFSTVIISIPWLQILAPVLLVPLVAGALAWVSIRRAPVVVRRAT
ncbi:lipoprotein release ABC transporter permease [Terrabacter tumescens]|uniref:Lipoprotein release ABC transporter permease n=1 Tax=Terrabacter tumescens TaxID=60443 RepID=A0ABQ2I5A5_9MICO|nr:ABC transporter permease [Terrabacter tumescens]GGN00955.1 lipoprotein release ABC transporter permease [Terrabacter tumescens]